MKNHRVIWKFCKNYRDFNSSANQNTKTDEMIIKKYLMDVAVFFLHVFPKKHLLKIKHFKTLSFKDLR